MAKDNYIVYKHTCPNGKVYIGITSRKPRERWHNGQGYKSHRFFWNAIQKYGWDSIQHDVLFEGLTKEEACKKEMELIALFKSNQAEYGYNLSVGGESGSKGAIFSEETRKKMSVAQKGKKMSKAARERMSKAAKGKKKSLAIIEKYKQYQITHNGKSVYQIDRNGVTVQKFTTIQEAEKITGVDNGHITAVCKGRRKTAGGYIWRYVEVA